MFVIDRAYANLAQSDTHLFKSRKSLRSLSHVEPLHQRLQVLVLRVPIILESTESTANMRGSLILEELSNRWQRIGLATG